MDKTLNGEIIPPESQEDLDQNAEEIKGNFWATFRKAASKIPFAEELVAAYYCALDPNSPFKVRATLLGALAYFIMPFDAVPDFILGLGFTDDIAVLSAAIMAVRGNITQDHRNAARQALEDVK